jgi:hypothetical protein
VKLRGSIENTRDTGVLACAGPARLARLTNLVATGLWPVDGSADFRLDDGPQGRGYSSHSRPFAANRS